MIELVAWILRGFNSEFGEQIPELPIELKIKYLKNGSLVLRLLAVGLVGYLIFTIFALPFYSHEGETYAFFVLLLVIGWVIAWVMSQKARKMNEGRQSTPLPPA